jgi:hypothetical protein
MLCNSFLTKTMHCTSYFQQNDEGYEMKFDSKSMMIKKCLKSSNLKKNRHFFTYMKGMHMGPSRFSTLTLSLLALSGISIQKVPYANPSPIFNPFFYSCTPTSIMEGRGSHLTQGWSPWAYLWPWGMTFWT